MKNYLFKMYILGYLNEYHINNSYLNNKNNHTYKEFKIKKVSDYTKISFRFLRIFISFISFFEIPISLAVLSATFIKYSFTYLITPSKRVVNKKLMFGLYNDGSYFNNVMNATGLKLDDIIIVKFPSGKFKYPNYKRISIFSGVDFTDILKSYFYSFEMIFYMKKKFAKRDFLLRAYSSFEYFLCFFFTNKSHISNIYIFDNLIDRFAYLHGGLEHKTIFIQHGIVNEKLKIKKIGKVDYAYYINEEEKDICEKTLFNNKPRFTYMKQSNFNLSSNKLLKNGFKNILLICNMLFFDKEKNIINSFSKMKLNLYIKPHPNSLIDSYEKLTIGNNLVLLEREDFPKVDMVISYHSTLATSYKNYGVEVLMYDDELFQYKLDNLLNINK